ncbi:MAG: response regulator transcription factor [Halanaerobium sp.]
MQKIIETINWEKLLNFIYETDNTVDINTYSYNFLIKLNNLIPFSAANFFLFENTVLEKEKTIVLNIADHVLEDYNQYYYQIDDIRKIAFDRPEASRSSDLMDYKSWSQNEYFNDFLAKNHLYYSAGIDIHFKEQLLGTVSLFREENDGDFNLTNLLFLELIRKYCSSQLFKILKINQLQNEKRLGKEKTLMIECDKYMITKRERDVLKLVLAGKSNKQIAEELFISINTVKKHLSHIYNKMNIKRRNELAALILK